MKLVLKEGQLEQTVRVFQAPQSGTPDRVCGPHQELDTNIWERVRQLAGAIEGKERVRKGDVIEVAEV